MKVCGLICQYLQEQKRFTIFKFLRDGSLAAGVPEVRGVPGVPGVLVVQAVMGA